MPESNENGIETVTDDRSIEELMASGDPADNDRAVAMMEAQLEGADMDVPSGNEIIEISEHEEEVPVEGHSDTEVPPVEELSTEQPSVDTEIPAEQSPAEQPPTTPENLLEVMYGGKMHTIQDPDGFMGRKDLDGLKKARAHQELYITDLQGDISTLQNQVSTLLAENNNLKSQLNAQPAVPQGNAVPSGEQPPAGQGAAPETVQAPTVPVRPELPEDPIDWTPEQSKQFREYQTQQDQYLQDLNKFVLSNQNVVAKDPRVDGLIADAEKWKGAYEELLNQKSQTQAEDADKRYWGDVDTFRNTHPEFNNRADVDSKALHHEVHNWMNQLVRAAGYAPLPVDASEEQISNFEVTKHSIAKKYLDGDPQLTQTGLQPPVGYDEYFKLGQLMQDRDNLIKSGALGQNASLHDAWVLLQDRNGALDAGIQNVEVSSRRAGAEAVLNAQRAHQTHDAINIPNSANQVPPAGSDQRGGAKYTDAQVAEAMNATALELEANPELLAIQEEILLSQQF